MSEALKLNKPWLVAVWPGMGNVSISAGYYLMAKLGMHVLAEFSPRELFDVNHVDVKDGLIYAARLPQSRLFLWNDPKQAHDIIVFIGEAQPPAGKYAFCSKLIKHVQELGVERVFTFAAMATQMHPEHPSRVFGAATDEQRLEELRKLDLEILNDAQISGLNGLLLGVAAENGLSGTCLMGEMPHIFAQVPYPKASLAVLRVFTRIAGIDVDLHELSQQAQVMDQKLGELLAKVETTIEQTHEPIEEEAFGSEIQEEERLSAAEKQNIERLFERAQQDRSKAYELKRELDRLDVFSEYEDRFLDLFKKTE